MLLPFRCTAVSSTWHGSRVKGAMIDEAVTIQLCDGGDHGLHFTRLKQDPLNDSYDKVHLRQCVPSLVTGAMVQPPTAAAHSDNL